MMLPPTAHASRFEPALGCQGCVWREPCGGFYEAGTLIDCLVNCCKRPEKCSYLCPENNLFTKTWRDTGGFSLHTARPISQDSPPPAYVPHLQHGYTRTRALRLDMAALTTFDVTRRDCRTKEMERDPAILRTQFRLTSDTPLLLCSIAEDADLENYWRIRKQRRLVEGIASIQPAHVIAPNFSLPRNVPRPDNLANLKRSLTCAEELSATGLSVIPYLAGITSRDWERWTDFLREHPEITMVAKEFQTGPAILTTAQWHIAQLAQLQESLGRPLHLVAVGGRRHIRLLRQFQNVTIIDSGPFMRTIHRRALTRDGIWTKCPTIADATLDDLLEQNIHAYTERIAHLLKTHPANPGPNRDEHKL